LKSSVSVHDFQDKYRSDVLTPWGIGRSTGFVYYTTQKKINEIYCHYNKQFPLDEKQLNEIQDFKAKLDEYDTIQERLQLDYSEVGFNNRDDEEEEDEALALAEEPESDEAQTQTASAASAVTGRFDDAQGILDDVRGYLGSLMNWLSLQYQKAKTLSSVSEK